MAGPLFVSPAPAQDQSGHEVVAGARARGDAAGCEGCTPQCPAAGFNGLGGIRSLKPAHGLLLQIPESQKKAGANHAVSALKFRWVSAAALF